MKYLIDPHPRLGLLRFEGMPQNLGLILKNCQQIHSKGMKFSFQALYLDKNFRVLGFTKEFKPNKIGPYIDNCYYVVELPIGTI
jgi:hypothetical protein